MPRYFLEIAYDGTPFEGWQVQPKADTVQQRLNDVLQKVLQEPIRTIGQGRTDAGVHALQSFCHFDTDSPAPDDLCYHINKMLPAEIAAKKLIPVHEDAHARFDAKWRKYQYHIHFEKDPFKSFASYYFSMPAFDKARAKKTARILMHYEDFKILSKYNPDVATTECDIMESLLIEKDGGMIYYVKSNRFLHNMVRRMVGLIIQSAIGKLTLNEIHHSMQNQIPLKYNFTAPACGLFLEQVHYDIL